MSGAGSTLIVVAVLAALSAWVLLVLRPWRHPQHAARYRPDPVDLPAFEDTVTFAAVPGAPPWELAGGEEPPHSCCCHAGISGEHDCCLHPRRDLVYGTAGGMGCDSGAMAAVRDSAGAKLIESAALAATLWSELDLPGEDGPVLPPSGPAGAGCESEGSGLTAPPAPVPWLERELGYLDDWARRMRAEWEL